MKTTHTQHGMISSAHRLEESVMCKLFHTHKEIQRVDAIPLKIGTDCLRQGQPRFLKCVWKWKRPSRMSIHTSARNADFRHTSCLISN